jgi:hypothetical protein
MNVLFGGTDALAESIQVCLILVEDNVVNAHNYCCIPPTILHRHNSKESTVHLCHTRTLSDNPIRLTRPA